MCNGAKMCEANRTTAAEKRQARNARVASSTEDVPLLPFVQEYSVPRPQQPFAHTQTKPVPDPQMT
ncbi:hypothetical protein DPMN_107414 [Dreissena polymorpha]|uniref:Uncharacterized protein n=1 Tax=Dreissena polymorpha TaxID=45954 RepID=A0A9D4K6N8_DREPO|nr:hypothetical protein DPMN_107414 [Dreissena polymorpha]